MKKSSEEIKISFSQVGRKIGAGGLLMTFAAGLGAYFNGVAQDLIKKKPNSLAQKNEKAIISIQAKANENEKNINRVYRKLENLDDGQREILILLRK